MSYPASPPQFVIDAAIAEANRSPCAKSKRGVAIFSDPGWDSLHPTRLFSCAHNAQPDPLKCDGSEACRNACAKLCEHAEAAALRKFDTFGASGDLLHVKTVDGQLVPSGGPSCWQCSRAILADRRIDGVWLFHEAGWRRYTPTEFHALTLAACGLPDLRGGHG